jgi:hypothetical protein
LRAWTQTGTSHARYSQKLGLIGFNGKMFSLKMEGELGEWSRKCSPVDVSHNQLKKRTQRGFRLALLQPVEDWSNMLSKLVRGGWWDLNGGTLLQNTLQMRSLGPVARSGRAVQIVSASNPLATHLAS